MYIYFCIGVLITLTIVTMVFLKLYITPIAYNSYGLNLSSFTNGIPDRIIIYGDNKTLHKVIKKYNMLYFIYNGRGITVEVFYGKLVFRYGLWVDVSKSVSWLQVTPLLSNKPIKGKVKYDFTLN